MPIKEAPILDLWDKRLLYALDGNARASLSEIGDALKRSPQWVKFRLERLREKGVLTHLYPLVEYRALGWMRAGILLRLHDVPPQEELKFLNSCYQESLIQSVYRCEGEYDLYLGAYAHNIDDLDAWVASFKLAHHAILRSLDITVETGMCKFRRHYLLGERAGEEEGMWIGRKKDSGAPVFLDAIDLAILDALNADPRISALDMAKQMHAGKDATLYRLRKLLKSGVVKGFSVQLNQRNFPVQSHLILLQCAGMDKQKQEELVQYCRLSDKVVRLSCGLGSYDYLIEAEGADRNAFRWFFKELKHRFAPHICRAQALQVYSLDKCRTYPTSMAQNDGSK